MSLGWEKTLGIVEVCRKWLIVPVCGLMLTCGRLYIDNHYVNKDYFDKAMITLSEDKSRYAADQKQDLTAINGKLDALLQVSAASGQRFNDAERRLTRLEDKQDRAGK